MDVSNKTKLEVSNLHLKFGEVHALNGIDFKVEQKGIHAIIGPNGAGKTCLLNCISGFYHAQQGDIWFNGRRISDIRPHKIAEMGIGRTFQNIELYTGLSTLDNLMAARHIHIKSNWLADAIYRGRACREESEQRKVVEGIIDFLEIEPIRKQVVGSLPYGLRKRVELGRALALEPRLLLLDEPMAGMNVEEKEDMARFILDTYERSDVTIILIEHDMGLVMDISDTVTVLDFGYKIAEGTPEEIRKTPAVIKAYLGSK